MFVKEKLQIKLNFINKIAFFYNSIFILLYKIKLLYKDGRL